MKACIQNLIEALRFELQQYGEMLALLDRQQELVIARAASEVFQCVGLIQAQSAAIQQARAQREDCRRALAEQTVLPSNTSFASLIPRLPPEYRPLLQALVEENNALLVRVHQRARQNHLLLSRSVEFMQSLLNSLLPGRETRVYNGQGATEVHTVQSHGLYEAVG